MPLAPPACCPPLARTPEARRRRRLNRRGWNHPRRSHSYQRQDHHRRSRVHEVAQEITIAGDRILAVIAGLERSDGSLWPAATRVVDLKNKRLSPASLTAMPIWTARPCATCFRRSDPFVRSATSRTPLPNLAQGRRPGEWIVTMPIGDQPYYFDVPEMLGREALADAAGTRRGGTRIRPQSAPSGAIGGRHLPLVSCANTEALRRAGVTRDTVLSVDTVKIEKDANGDPTGVFVEREMAPVAELIWFHQAGRVHACGSPAHLAAIGARLPCVWNHQCVRWTRRVSTELLRTYKQAHREGALTMRGCSFCSVRTGGGAAPRCLAFVEAGRVERASPASERLVQDERTLRSRRARGRRRCARARCATYGLG